MSGHSKWSNIKHRKAKGDAVRGKIFTKIGREIAVAVKGGGSDPATNSRLADVIAKARANNMPNDNISRSIKKASGELGNINYEAIIYEGYGAGGAAVIVEALTENKNRTAGEVRCAFDKFGGSMGTTNCVSYLFERKGVIVAERNAKMSEDEIFEAAISAGAEDVQIEEDIFEVFTATTALGEVKNLLEKQNIRIENFSGEWIPSTTIKLSGDNLDKFIKMIDMLEDSDDVQEVFHNVELPQEDTDA